MNGDRLDLSVDLRSECLCTDDWYLFQDIESVQSIDYFPKDRVLHVQMRLLSICDEELRCIRIWAVICHGKDSSRRVFQVFSQLIFKLPAPNGRTSFPSVCRISRLDHESFDVSMEDTAIIVVTRAESKKVLTSLWTLFDKEFKLDVSDIRMNRH